MDYGNVGVCAVPATGVGAGVGGVSYAGVVQRVSYPWPVVGWLAYQPVGAAPSANIVAVPKAQRTVV
jgi:hypothetical protein